MQTQAFSETGTSEARESSISLENWYISQHDDSRRIYCVYTPANYKAETAVPLIMVLHGCAQPIYTHPWAIARDTRMNQLAEEHQFLVVYPHHFAPPDFNPCSCWDFFLRKNQHRDIKEGESASLAGIVDDMLKNPQWKIDRDRIYVAGISSGGGAAVNLGVTYPDVFAAIAVHSGAEYGLLSLPFRGKRLQARDATEQLTKEEAISGQFKLEEKFGFGPGPDPVKQGEKAFQAMESFARVVPTIVFHGTADTVSDPRNGGQVAQQWITTNHLASPNDFTATYEHPSNTVYHPAGPHGEKSYTVYTWQDTHGRDVVTYYKIDGMWHRWSGGTPGSIFTEPKGPDASKIIYEFFMAHPKEEKETEYPPAAPTPSARPGRRALCVGINEFENLPKANWLNGCEHDAQDMVAVLRDVSGFSQDQISVLTNTQATKARIYSELQDMVEKATNGQVNHLVFSFSSHGTQVPDPKEDEPDQADEALCAYDIRVDASGDKWDPSTILTDDELHDLFTQLPPSVLLEVYFDTCHSGTGLRAADLLPGRRPKFLPPPTGAGLRDMDARRLVNYRDRLVSYREMAAKARTAHPHHVLFAACLDSQTASDAVFAGRPNGAFTYFLVKHMRAVGDRVTRQELLDRISTDLKRAEFTQTPQLEASATDRSLATAATHESSKLE